MERRNQEAGQALILGVVALSVLLVGIAGMGIDMGYMRYQKRLMQTAADAAAIAGASNLAYTGVIAAAHAAAVTNGFTDSSSNTLSTCTNDTPTTKATSPPTVCVQINNPPLSGPHASDANYVEAYVSVVEPTFFMTLLGTNSEPVTARAVATNTSVGTNNGCLYTLGPPGAAIDGTALTGNATLSATTCGIVDNGDLFPTGSSFEIDAGTFGVSGTCSGSGCGKGDIKCADQSSSDCPAYSTPAAADPFASLTPPCSPCTGGGAWVPGNGPGTYSGISVPANTTVNFTPGVYIVNGGNLDISANSTVTGTGVMFYFTNGATVNMHGTPNVNLSAPTALTGTNAQYNGILYYQDPNDTSGPLITGNGTDTYNGALYFPKALVTFKGNATVGAFALVVADALALSGHPTVNLVGAAGLGGATNSIKDAVLVE